MSSRREFDRYTGASVFPSSDGNEIRSAGFHRETLSSRHALLRRSTTENSSDYLIKMWVDLFLGWNLLNRSAESFGRRSWSPKRGTKPTNDENYGARGGGEFR